MLPMLLLLQYHPPYMESRLSSHSVSAIPQVIAIIIIAIAIAIHSFTALILTADDAIVADLLIIIITTATTITI